MENPTSSMENKAKDLKALLDNPTSFIENIASEVIKKFYDARSKSSSFIETTIQVKVDEALKNRFGKQAPRHGFRWDSEEKEDFEKTLLSFVYEQATKHGRSSNSIFAQTCTSLKNLKIQGLIPDTKNEHLEGFNECLEFVKKQMEILHKELDPNLLYKRSHSASYVLEKLLGLLDLNYPYYPKN